MRHRSFAYAVALFVLPLAGACLTDFEEFDFTFETSAGGSGGGTGATGPGGDGPGGNFGPGGTGGSGTGGTGTGGTGTGTGGSGTGGSGTGGNPTGVTVACGGSCDITGGDICCIPPGEPTNASCETQCTGGDAEVSCDEPADCPGQVCCGDFSFGQNGYIEISCQASCTGQGAITLCASQADCSGNESCQQSQYLPSGYMVCRP